MTRLVESILTDALKNGVLALDGGFTRLPTLRGGQIAAPEQPTTHDQPGTTIAGLFRAHNQPTKGKYMALKLIANYSKRLGLPGYSSHQYSVCVETEISNINDVAGESSRLYQSLQQSVDEEIQHTGFVPDHGYGMEGKTNGSANGHDNRTNGHSAPANGNGNGNGHTNGDGWTCSDKQRDLILKLVDEHQLDKGQVDDTSRDMFGVGVRELNKLQASGLIERILDEHGGGRNKAPRTRSTPPRRAYANGGAR
jgi:hypothetical protein